jgi:hypothetical protein
MLFAVAWLGLAGCSREPSPAPTAAAEPAAPSDEMGEPHDQSAFGKDPSQTHLMSPDEPDLHPQPGPDRPEAR